MREDGDRLLDSEEVNGPGHPAVWETPVGVLVIGALYVAGAWSGARIFTLYAVPYRVDADYLRGNGLVYMLAHASLGVLPLSLLLLNARRNTNASQALTGERVSLVLQTMIAAGVAAFLVDLTGLWNWLWRWRDSAFRFGLEAVEARAWGAILLGVLVFGVLFPIVEEVVFRYGMLTTVLRLTRSRVVAALASSFIFAALHFGPSFQLSGNEVGHAIRLFGFGLALSVLTFARDGRILLPIAVHAGRNTAEQIALYLWILAPT